MQETWVRSLDLEDPLEKGQAISTPVYQALHTSAIYILTLMRQLRLSESSAFSVSGKKFSPDLQQHAFPTALHSFI